MTESLGNVIFNLGSRMPRLKINQKHEKKYPNLKTKEENILMKDGKIREEKLEKIDINVCIAESLCCIPDTNATL